MPGLVEKSGVLRFAPNLRGVTEFDVRGALAARFPGVAQVLDNIDTKDFAVAAMNLKRLKGRPAQKSANLLKHSAT